MFENFRVFETELAGRPLVVETGKYHGKTLAKQPFYPRLAGNAGGGVRAATAWAWRPL